MTDPDYNRDVRHYRYDISGLGWDYGTGDCLNVSPHNSEE